MVSRKTARISMRVSSEDKKLLENKADELGYKSISALVRGRAYDHFVIKLDLS